MPYQPSPRLSGEKASKLGHLEVLKSKLVNELVQAFSNNSAPSSVALDQWEQFPPQSDPLPYIFSVDGSLQVLHGDPPLYKSLAFVKTALFRLDQPALAKLNPSLPHPYALRDILADAARCHSTVLPMKHVIIDGISLLDTVRQTIFESVLDASLDAEPMATLKWLAYEKWDGQQKGLPNFECPHCETQQATLPYDAEVGGCPNCGGELFITDMLGFHLEMSDDAAPETVASAYMNIHETLLLFTGIRYFWETKKEALTKCLFIKDGPLSIRAQYSKLVNPIRRFLEMAHSQEINVCIVGQEKTGAFVEHLEMISPEAKANSLFIPGDKYIRQEIQHRSASGMPYGRDTNYGTKVFIKVGERHSFVLNIPTGLYKQEPVLTDLIGATQIISTLPSLLSSRYENGLLPIELANNIASLSTYPSAHVLSLFAKDLLT